jgi:hypothetical protein
MTGLLYTSYYTNGGRVLKNLLFGCVVGFEGFVHPICGVAAHGGYPVGATVEGHGDRGVSQEPRRSEQEIVAG